jgi:hypothetical protein
MNKLLLGFAALPFVAGLASAADRLDDAQMDRITAGASVLPTITIDCPTCVSATSGQTSSTMNGVTVVVTTGGLPSGGSGSNTGTGSSNTGTGSGGTPNFAGLLGASAPRGVVTVLPPNLLATTVGLNL